jgi:hypothetical protein
MSNGRLWSVTPVTEAVTYFRTCCMTKSVPLRPVTVALLQPPTCTPRFSIICAFGATFVAASSTLHAFIEAAAALYSRPPNVVTVRPRPSARSAPITNRIPAVSRHITGRAPLQPQVSRADASSTSASYRPQPHHWHSIFWTLPRWRSVSVIGLTRFRA